MLIFYSPELNELLMYHLNDGAHEWHFQSDSKTRPSEEVITQLMKHNPHLTDYDWVLIGFL